MILLQILRGNLNRGHVSLPVWRRQVGRHGRIIVWSLCEGGLNGMRVWHVGEQVIPNWVRCSSDAGGSCGAVNHRVHGHFNWVRVFARITASVVLVSHSGTSRALRGDLDILQAYPRVGL